MYRAETQGIVVEVQPRFIAEHSDPASNRFVWAYDVDITNASPEPVQLRARYWRIVDGMGQVREVSGEGVVGEQPIITPGATYSYTSHCPLSTPSGIMGGHYFMVRADGSAVTVTIPTFSLDMPQAGRVLN